MMFLETFVVTVRVVDSFDRVLELTVLATLISANAGSSAPLAGLVGGPSRASVMVGILSHVGMAVMAALERACDCLDNEDS